MILHRTLQEELGVGGGAGGVVEAGGAEEGTPDPLLDELTDADIALADSQSPKTPDIRSRRSSDTSEHAPAGSSSFIPNTELTQPEDSTAAERFKYIICSSGLLDKDFLADRHDDTPPSTASPVQRDPAPLVVDSMATLRNCKQWTRVAVERWDISLAGIVLVLGIMVVIGWRRVFFGIAAVSGGVGAGVVWRYRQQAGTERPHVDNEDAQGESAQGDYLEQFLNVSRSLDNTIQTSLHLLEPSPAISYRRALRTALHQTCDALNDQLADTSSALGALVDKDEFRVLAAMYDIPLGRRGAGVAHSTNDNLGADADIRRGLGLGAIPSPRREMEDRLFSPPSTIRPTRPRSLVLAPLQASWDMQATRSLPPTTPLSGHSRHLSLLPSLPVNITSATPENDRFTSLPRRTPRLSKRASWDPDAWRSARSAGAEQASQRSAPIALQQDAHQLIPSSHALHTPKKTSPLSGRSHELPSRPSLTESALRMAALSNAGCTGSPSSASGSPHASKRHSLQPRLALADNPKRRSLQSLTYFPADASDMLRTASSSSTVSELQQARERASDGSRRRRASIRSNLSISSMQSVPALPASPFAVQGGHSYPPGPMMRALPPSMAEASMPGSHTHRPDRVASLSPLTHPALQAACLGTHLRRRRVACELLALRWNHADEASRQEYWDDVEAAVRQLTRGIEQAVANLKLACVEAEKESHCASQSSPIVSSPPWRHETVSAPSKAEWAPRTTDEEHLSARVTAIQQQLEVAWAATTRTQVALGNHGAHDEASLSGLVQVWSELQSAVGEMSREVGSGRAILRDRERALAADALQPDHSSDSDGHADLPDFVQHWDTDAASDSHTARSTSIGTMISESHASGDPLVVAHTDDLRDQANMDSLPAIGKDEVFEASIAADLPKRDTALSGLSRGERIALTKQAREMGLTLKELLQSGAPLSAPGADMGPQGNGGLVDIAAAKQKQADKVAQMARLGLVDELRGMMGEIQRRKER